MNFSLIDHHKFILNDKYFLFDTTKIKAYRINKEFYNDIPSRKSDELNKALIESLSSIDFINYDSQYAKISENKKLNRFYNLYALSINVAQICNMRCNYCYGKNGEYGNRGLMNLETAIKSIDFLIKYSGDLKKLAVVFFGGEPLLNFELIKRIVIYCNKAGRLLGKHFNFSITTNGSLLNSETISFLIRNKFSVTISFDGDKKSQDTNRPLNSVDSSYDFILPRLRKYLKEKNKEPIVRVTITKDSSESVIIKECLKKIGFERIELIPVSSKHELSITKKKLFKDLIINLENDADEFIRNVKTRLNIYPNSFVEIVTRLINKSKKEHFCGAGRTFLAVSSAGEIYPCHRFVGDNKMILGTVDSLNHNATDLFQLNAGIINERCIKCWIRNFCGGGCYHDNFENSGHICKPNQYSCRLLGKKVEYAIYAYDSLSNEDKLYFKKSIGMNS